MNTEVIEKPSTELTVTARAAVASKALEAPAEPIIESDPIFNQEDGGELLDGPADTWPQSEIVIATAVNAVADRFNESWPEAVSRLGAIDWSAITPGLLEQAA